MAARVGELDFSTNQVIYHQYIGRSNVQLPTFKLTFYSTKQPQTPRRCGFQICSQTLVVSLVVFLFLSPKIKKSMQKTAEWVLKSPGLSWNPQTLADAEPLIAVCSPGPLNCDITKRQIQPIQGSLPHLPSWRIPHGPAQLSGIDCTPPGRSC